MYACAERGRKGTTSTNDHREGTREEERSGEKEGEIEEGRGHLSS
jgi:hypothetical protein